MTVDPTLRVGNGATTNGDEASAAAVAPPGSGEMLQLLTDGIPRTRAELVELSGWARSTVAARIDALVESGLVVGVGEAASSGGRPPSRFGFNPSAGVVVALDLGATRARIAITNLARQVLASALVDLPIVDGPEVVLDGALRVAAELLDSAGYGRDSVLGIGIGVPGPVAHDTGRPTHPPIMPGWHDFDVPGYVAAILPAPVFVDNDVNIMALGEQRLHWPDRAELLFVKVATGIGAGLVSQHVLLRGADGTAGDLGHVRVSRGDEVRCRCGNIGCLEALAGAPMLIEQLIGRGLTVGKAADIVAAVQRGDRQATDVVQQAGRDIGEVVATCVSLFNPGVIVVGGELAKTGDHLLQGIRDVVYGRSPPLATSHLAIVCAKSGDDAGIIGAAALVLENELAPAAVDARLMPKLLRP